MKKKIQNNDLAADYGKLALDGEDFLLEVPHTEELLQVY